MKKIIVFALSLLLLPYCVTAQSTAEEQDTSRNEKANGKKEKSASKIKPYSEVITDEASTDQGLITTHKIVNKHYFEIPDNLLEKEILVVTRISGFVKGLNFGGAGVKSRPQQVVRWQKKDEQIMLRSVSYNSVADENTPIYTSVKNNNFEPVILVFDILSYNEDSTASVIEVNPLFTTDVEMLGAVSPTQRKNFGIKALDVKRSFINSVKSFPENVEVKHVLTYKGDAKLPDNKVTGTMSVELNQSFILLPEKPMQPRLYDARVGYFSLQHTDYSLNEQKAANRRYITRWRLEPKDMEAYTMGELVEPIKPIVYYIDPATPEEWRPYIKQGVEDWQVAFEEAGFKNAIIAKDPPTKEEDPDWSPEDVRYSVIRYVSTDIQNAMGPHVHDPRTGEILESDIIWYHNVMNLLRNWFFIQTSAINPDARRVQFEADVMGRLIRFVAAHEVGHTLGLPHNMGSSVAYPVDSLRSPEFTEKMGTAPSIMDYARFNYVAQPGDAGVSLMPNIGPYDKWSIQFGYKLLPEYDSPGSERETINQWIIDRSNNPLFRFGRGGRIDPSSQTEDLGDDSMLASEYGIKNLKRIVPNLIDWTAEDGKNFDDLHELYEQVYNQFRRYTGHVITNIGGVYEIFKTYDENDVTYKHTPKGKQMRAMQFLDKHVFSTPGWLVDQSILRRFEPSGNMERINNLQSQSLANLFNGDRMKRLIENEALNGAAAYSIQSLFDDSKRAIFREITQNQSSDFYRRNMHRSFINRMQEIMKMEDNAVDRSDIKALARVTLRDIQEDCKKFSKKSKSRMDRVHADDLYERIEMILNPK